MSFSNYLRENLLDEVFGGDNFSPTAELEIGLSTSEPNDDDTNVEEPTGNDYARVVVDNDSTTWNSASTTDGATPDGITQKTNATEIEFPQATGAWGTVSHFVIYDDADNLLGWGELVTPKTIEDGDTARFAEGDLTIQLS